MGQLLYTEHGRVHLAISEPITRWRWARKMIDAPEQAAASPATLWLYLWQAPGNRAKLDILFNDELLDSLDPDKCPSSCWTWCSVAVPRGVVRPFENGIVLRSENPARSGWSVGVELGHARSCSQISFDRGRTWDPHGVADIGGGEYVVRLRSHAEALRDPLPRMIYERLDHPCLAELRELVPSSIRLIADRHRQLLALRAWVSRCWRHQPRGTLYTPWDAPTILDWNSRQIMAGIAAPIGMCVHYGSLFASFAMALGHTARCVVTTGDINSADGHFMVEVWNPHRAAWELHDPNTDVHYEDPHMLSAMEVYERVRAGGSLHAVVRRADDAVLLGEAHRRFYEDCLLSGRTFRHLALWRCNDFVSFPRSAPLAHGSVTYVETDLIWHAAPSSNDMAMFPYRVPDRGFFTSEPHGGSSAPATHEHQKGQTL